MKKYLVLLSVLSFASNIVYAGGGPHEKIPDCKYWTYVEQPAELHEHSLVDGLLRSAKDGQPGVRVQITETYLRKLSPRGQCQPVYDRLSASELKLKLSSFTKNYQPVSEQVISITESDLIFGSSGSTVNGAQIVLNDSSFSFQCSQIVGSVGYKISLDATGVLNGEPLRTRNYPCTQDMLGFDN